MGRGPLQVTGDATDVKATFHRGAALCFLFFSFSFFFRQENRSVLVLPEISSEVLSEGFCAHVPDHVASRTFPQIEEEWFCAHRARSVPPEAALHSAARKPSCGAYTGRPV